MISDYESGRTGIEDALVLLRNHHLAYRNGFGTGRQVRRQVPEGGQLVLCLDDPPDGVTACTA